MFLEKLPPLDAASANRLTDLIFGGGVDPETLRVMEETVSQQIILVTGAGGSIGGALCKRLAALYPQRVVMVDISEHGLYQTHRATGWDDRFVTVMGDIRDQAKMRAVFDDFRPALVVHAAALKHVPMLELPHNIVEAVKTNVLGTHVVCAESSRVAARMVLVSTDKAVSPASTLGLTKRIAEHVVSTLWQQAPGEHSIVRFGNVMNSSGSAIPLFKEQISKGGPVTVTDRDMTRFMMTLSQAVDLVLASLSLPPQLHVLDMGDPIRILDLARMLIRMADKEPIEDVAIEEIGIRPGEKLYEELFYSHEQPLVSNWLPGIMSVPLVPATEIARVQELMADELVDPVRVRSLLEAVCPNYQGTWN